MGFVTQVPQPYFGPNGFVAPTEDAVLTGVQADMTTALGGDMNLQLTTPQGQLAMTLTAEIGDSNAQFLQFVNGVDPALNSGRMQDAIGRIYFMTRIASAPTVQECVCNGLATTPIPVGALASDPDTNLLWMCTQAGPIGAGGNVTLTFSCTTNGPVPGPASLVIYQSVPGWESVVPTGDAVLGNDVESPSQFELRRQNSVAANSISTPDSILGAVLGLSGVLDAYVLDNPSATIQVVGGVTIGPNSIYVCVLGGTSSAIAMAIWTKKPPGCAYNGNTTVTVVDPNPAYNPPAPSYSVSYTTPSIVPFAVVVTMKNSAAVPANALMLVQQAIVNGFAGLDGGSRVKIGSTVFASRYYPDVANLGTWALIISLQIGLLGQACTFNGQISGTTLTVNSISAGSLAAGQLLQDAGLMQQGTLIVNQLTGSPGSTGTYTVSISQSLGAEPMTATTLVNDATMNINQAPAISAANICLILE